MKKKSIGVGIGTSSLMMIFTILCLTIFALLSLLQANNSLAQSENYASSISDYYNADNEAMHHKIMIENGEVEYDINDEGNIEYDIRVDDDSYLDIMLDSNFEIVKWRLVNDVDGDYGNQGFDF